MFPSLLLYEIVCNIYFATNKGDDYDDDDDDAPKKTLWFLPY